MPNLKDSVDFWQELVQMEKKMILTEMPSNHCQVATAANNGHISLSLSVVLLSFHQ